MKLNLPALVPVFLSLVFAACADPPQFEPATTIIDLHVVDGSVGAAPDPLDRCRELAFAAKQHLDKRSRVLFLAMATGGKESGGEPTLLVKLPLKVTGNIFGDGQDLDAAKTKLLSEINTRCEEKMRQTTVSPIYRAVVRATAEIENACRELEQNNSRCGARRLTVHSDLREGEISEIKKAIASNAKDLTVLDKFKIDLSGIDVSVCGRSSTTERAVSVDAVERVWTHLFGTSFTISADCPQ